MTTNEALLLRRQRAVPRGIATAFPIMAARAENAELWDVEGRRYIDFAGGIAVLNVGHRHPRVVEAVQAQLGRFTHTAFQVMAYEPYIELAEKLNALAPFSAPAKTILFTTGAEAVENAVKIARAATGRSGVIAFTGAFHGRTALTMALTGKVVPYKKGLGNVPGDVFHVPFPTDSQRVSVEDSLRAIDFLFRADIDPSSVAAILIEPVQGEGGFNPAPFDLLARLRALCDAHGILLIADEVQAGFGRTGKMFGIEHSGVEPDLIAIAKSLAGGLPLSGVIGRADILDAIEPGGLGGTYGGNPLACAAALAVLDVIEREHLVERAARMGTVITERLRKIAQRNDVVPMAAIRGLGAMIGFDIVKAVDGRTPDPDATKRVTAAALEAGLIVLSCGVYGNTIRILVPLTVSDEVLEEGIAKLERALAAARRVV
jgi:4-aminobutyrate aminotransferase/(S)-3-amino-2-methylpropionate transaminase